MSEQSNNLSPLKIILGLAVILLISALGMYLGSQSRELFSDEQEMEYEPDIFKNLTLVRNSEFPDIPLTDDNLNAFIREDYLNAEGTVILFIDAGCPPCHALVKRWQEKINAGVITPDRVLAITFSEVEDLKDLINHYGVTFKILSDKEMNFLERCGVDAFPLLVITDSNYKINFSTYNANEKIADGELFRYLTIME